MSLPISPVNSNAGSLVKFVSNPPTSNPMSNSTSKDVTLTFNGKTFRITRLTLRKDGVEKAIDPNTVELDQLAKCCEAYFNLINPTVDSASEVSFTFKQTGKTELALRQIHWINSGEKDPHIQEIMPEKSHQALNARVFELVKHILTPDPKTSNKRKTPQVQALPPPAKTDSDPVVLPPILVN